MDLLGERRRELDALRERALPLHPEDEPIQRALRRERSPDLCRSLDAARPVLETWGGMLGSGELSEQEARRLEHDIEASEADLEKVLEDPRCTERVPWRFECEVDAGLHDTLAGGKEHSLIPSRQDPTAMRSVAGHLSEDAREMAAVIERSAECVGFKQRRGQCQYLVFHACC